jgi:hypothetical protein
MTSKSNNLYLQTRWPYHTSGGWSPASHSGELGSIPAVHAGFILDKVEVREIFLHVLRYFDSSHHSTHAPYSFINRDWYNYSFETYHHQNQRRDSSVGITNRLCAGRSGFYGSIPWGKGAGWEFSSTPHPERFFGAPSLLSNRYRRFFPWGWSCRGMKLTIHLHSPYTSSWRCA